MGGIDILKVQDNKLGQLVFRRSIVNNIFETCQKETKQAPSKQNANYGFKIRRY